jgi:hypothetical protein
MWRAESVGTAGLFYINVREEFCAALRTLPTRTISPRIGAAIWKWRREIDRLAAGRFDPSVTVGAPLEQVRYH